MSYDDLRNSASYQAKVPGAATEVYIVDANDPAQRIIGASTGINMVESYETIPVEEGGNDGVDEFMQGRHDAGATVGAFFTPDWNDRMPTRQDFLGREFTIFERFGPTFPNAGEILNVYIGCRINRVTLNSQARGARTFDIGIAFTRRYNGAQWASLAGA